MKKFLLILFFAFYSAVGYGQKVCVSDIYITGNSITSKSVILRELPFKAGDTLQNELFGKYLVEAKENLLNTSLFNYVTLKSAPLGSQNEVVATRVTVEVEERWYFWPIFEMRLEDRNMTSWMKKMDWKRVTFYSGLKVNNMFGLGHKMEIRGMAGWEKGIDLSYSRVAIGKAKKIYLSGRAYAMFFKHVDFKTENNKLQHLSDEGYMKRSYGANLNFTYRPQIRWTGSATFSYDYSKISGKVLDENPDYWGMNSRSSQTFSLETSICHDDRNDIFYPTEGKYASLNLKLSESNHFDFSYARVLLDLQFYRKLSDRWMASSSLKLSSSISNRYSYIHSNAVGYEISNITGYELYVIDGQHYITQNNSIKYLILPQRVVHIGNNPKWRKFNKPHITIYGKLLYDFGYVFQEHKRQGNNTYPNSFLAGLGTGLDLVTYYDMVLSVGYAVNNRGKGSFLFGFRTPIF